MSSSLHLQVRIAAIQQEAAGIVSLTLVDPGGRALPPFTAGAHIDVEVAPGLIRQYSLFNEPEASSCYRIAVLREPKTRGGSRAVHEALRAGDTLVISAPRNHFELIPSPGRTLLFAGGIGITPIYSMAHELHRTSMPFDLHYCARSQMQAAFCETLSNERWHESVHFHFDDGPEAQRLDLDMLGSCGPEDQIYVCGPRGFMDHVIGAAERAGWDASRIHREYFNAEQIDTSDDGSFTVKIDSTGDTFLIPANRSVVEVLNEAGYDIHTSCSEGVCGTCITRILSGCPLHRDMVLSDEERAAEDQFTPCVSRSKTPLLVLDL